MDSSVSFKNKNIRAIFSITLMSVLGVASLTPAFPKIARELNLSNESIGLLIMVFTIPGIILAPLSGMLADRFGRKQILVPALFLFGIAGSLCGFTKDFNILVLLRFFQGTGAAALGTLNLTLIADIFKGKDRGIVMGYNSSVLSIATASYPFIGGVLASFAWNYPFFLPVLAFPIGIFVYYKIDNPDVVKRQSFRKNFSAVLKVLKTAKAMVYLWTNLATFIILYGVLITNLPFLLAHKFNFNPFIIGLLFSFSSIATAIMAAKAGKLAIKYNPVKLISFAFLIYATSMVILPNINNYWLILLPLLLYGAAQGLNMPNSQALIASIAPEEQRAFFMSINGMILFLGQTVGPLLMGIAYFYGGLQIVFYSASILALITAVLMYKFGE